MKGIAYAIDNLHKAHAVLDYMTGVTPNEVMNPGEHHGQVEVLHHVMDLLSRTISHLDEVADVQSRP